jgi:hypothetical protein
VSNAAFEVGSWLTLRWTRGTRYYRVHLEQDLWTGWLLTQVHGRIGSRLGRARSFEQPSIEAVPQSLNAGDSAAIGSMHRQLHFHRRRSCKRWKKRSNC